MYFNTVISLGVIPGIYFGLLKKLKLFNTTNQKFNWKHGII